MKKLTPTPMQKPLVKRRIPLVAGVLLVAGSGMVCGEPGVETVGEPAVAADAGEPGDDDDAGTGN